MTKNRAPYAVSRIHSPAISVNVQQHIIGGHLRSLLKPEYHHALGSTVNIAVKPYPIKHGLPCGSCRTHCQST